MLQRLGRFTIRRRRLVLLGAVGFVVLAGALGGGVASHLTTSGFDDPNSESIRPASKSAFHTVASSGAWLMA